LRVGTEELAEIRFPATSGSPSRLAHPCRRRRFGRLLSHLRGLLRFHQAGKRYLRQFLITLPVSATTELAVRQFSQKPKWLAAI
jgi:hypothetical protein